MNKKISLFLFGFLLVASGISQEVKKIRFGLKGIPSLNWYRPDDNKIKNNGTGLGLGWGLISEFGLADNVSLATGIQFDNDRGKLSYLPGDTSNYFIPGANYIFIDPDVIMTKNFDKDTVGKIFEAFNLREREYKVKYVTLPVILKMRTKEIGYFTYFGQFGFDFSFKTKATANDRGISYNTTKPYEKSKIDVSSDVSLFRLQLSVGGGAEWNLSGSTSLVFGLNYNRGFNNILRSGFKKNSNHLFMVDNNNNTISYAQKAFADNLALTIGILF